MVDGCGMIFMRFADNDFGPDGGDHVSSALTLLTGLQHLDLSCAFFHCCTLHGIDVLCIDCGIDCVFLLPFRLKAWLMVAVDISC